MVSSRAWISARDAGGGEQLAALLPAHPAERGPGHRQGDIDGVEVLHDRAGAAQHEIGDLATRTLQRLVEQGLFADQPLETRHLGGLQPFLVAAAALVLAQPLGLRHDLGGLLAGGDDDVGGLFEFGHVGALDDARSGPICSPTSFRR